MTTLQSIVLFVLAYSFVAAVSALPDDRKDFEFYTWAIHVLRSLLNIVPPKYKAGLTQQNDEVKNKETV